MPVAFNATLLTELIEMTGGVIELLRCWEVEFGDADVPDRQSVYNWRAGKLPKTSITVIRLAHLLDVDPFCLFEAKGKAAADVIGEVFEAYQLATSAEPGLQFFQAFFGWKPLWPPPYWEEHRRRKPTLRQNFQWHQQEFVHDITVDTNYDATVAVHSDPAFISARPQTFHFAFSGKGALKARWMQYGFVVRHRNHARLTHIHGHIREAHTEGLNAPTLVATWFGPGPATFRVASLQPFELEFRGKDSGDGERVQFPG